jgi:thiol-disulfide isomerase/thioredoxin
MFSLQNIIKFLIMSVVVTVVIVGASLADLYINYGGRIEYQDHRFKPYRKPVSLSDYYFYDTSGNLVTMSELSGRPVVLLLWATWCGYCAKEMPKLEAFIKKHDDLGFELIALAEPADTPTKIKHFYKRLGLDMLKPYIASSPSIYKKTAVKGVPSFIMVDQSGNALGTMKPDWSKLDSFNVILNEVNK